MSTDSKLIVAIDGPAGAGKSTTAVQVARRLNLLYIDTGAMYRAMAVAILASGISRDETDALNALIDRTDIKLIPADGTLRIMLDGRDVSDEIRTPEVTAASSPLSQIPRVRKRLIALQRLMGAENGAVLEGRDIGTVVFPDAQVKIYLTASVAERAQRRLKDLTARGIESTLESVAAAIRERDDRDMNRAESPLKPACDAVPLDTTGMTLEQQIDKIVEIAEARR